MQFRSLDGSACRSRTYEQPLPAQRRRRLGGSRRSVVFPQCGHRPKQPSTVESELIKSFAPALSSRRLIHGTRELSGIGFASADHVGPPAANKTENLIGLDRSTAWLGTARRVSSAASASRMTRPQRSAGGIKPMGEVLFHGQASNRPPVPAKAIPEVRVRSVETEKLVFDMKRTLTICAVADGLAPIAEEKVGTLRPRA